jgi:hypothetical protein
MVPMGQCTYLQKLGCLGGEKVVIEEVMTLSDFMSTLSKDPQEYKLFGVVVHEGQSMDSGHYYACVKNEISLENVLSEQAYILFFSRGNKKHESDCSLAIKGIERLRNKRKTQEVEDPCYTVEKGKSNLWKNSKMIH